MKNLFKKTLCLALAATLTFGSFSFDVKAAEIENESVEAPAEEPSSDVNIETPVEEETKEAVAPSKEPVVEEPSEDPEEPSTEEIPSEEKTDAEENDKKEIDLDDPHLADYLPIDQVTDEMTQGDPGWYKAHGYIDEYFDHNENGEIIDENGFVIDSLDANNGTGMPYHAHAVPSKYSNCKLAKGIDVSKWQGNIDWNAVRNSGVTFAFIRVAHRRSDTGVIDLDPYADANLAGAKAAGIKVGIYVFSQATNAAEAVAEANIGIQYADKYGLDLPIVMDYEFSGDKNTGKLHAAYNNGTLNKDKATQVANAFCARVAQAGYLPCIYASKNFLLNSINGEYLGSIYQIWVAQYLTTYNCTNYEYDFRYWQASSNGAISGISGNVDLDYWYAPPWSITYKNVPASTSTMKVENKSPKVYYEGYGVTLKAPTNSQWAFLGWYADAKLSKKVTSYNYKKSGNITLYAKWGVTVNLDANGGYCDAKYICVDPGTTRENEAGEEVTNYPFEGYLENVEPVRSGYDFEGWYDTAGNVVTTKTAYNETTMKTLTAKWKLVRVMTNPVANISTNATVDYGTDLVLSSQIKNSKIFYTMTTDGSTPADPQTLTDKAEGTKVEDLNSKVYTEPIELTGNVRIKFIATKTAYKDSGVVELKINVNPEVEDPGDITEDVVSLKTENFWTTVITDQTYTGAAIKPEPGVYWNKKLLTLNKDYTLAYKNNVNVGTATVTIKGKGNYTGSFVKTFNIVPKDITPVFAGVEDIAVVYNPKKAQSPNPVLVDVKKKLAIKRDYTLTWTNDNGEISKGCTASGDYQVTVAGTGNYTGSDTFIFRILPEGQVLMNSVSVGKIPNKVYDGENYKPELAVTYKKLPLEAGVDYDITYESNDSAIGSHELTITAKSGSDFYGSKTIKYNVTGVPITKAKVAGISTTVVGVYDGKEKKLTGYALTYNGTDLVEGTDYEVTYAEGTNINAGAKATVIFTGKGSYTGVMKKTFKIGAYNIATNEGSKLEVSFTNPGAKTLGLDSFIYVKGGTTPEYTVSFTDGNGVKQTLVNGKDYKVGFANNGVVTTQKLIDAKKTPTLILTGKGNFTGVFKKEFAIVQSDIADMNISIADRALDSKAANRFAPTIAITESNNVKNPKLAANTDFKIVKYTYAEETVVRAKVNGVLKSQKRTAGTEVQKDEIIREATSITVTLEGVNNYKGTYSETYSIYTKNIATAAFKIDAQDYTGKEIKLKESQIALTYGSGKNKVTLDGSDFDILSYKNNINKGTATVVIQGVGEYGGTKALTFKIKDKTVNYTIVYDKNNENATGTMKNSLTASGGRLAANTYKLTNYTFAGWALEATATNADYANRAAFYQKGAKFESGSEITLYAIWKPVEYKIIYKLNGGVNNADNPNTHNVETPVTLKAPTRTGYIFGGWYTDAKFNNAITTIETTTKQVTVFARWTVDESASHDLFVAPNGNDENAGTVGAPFRTVQAALDAVKPGQTVYLRKGTYTGPTYFSKSGTAGNLITLTSYPGEKATLTMKAGTDGAALALNGKSYIKITNLSIGNISGAAVAGILLQGGETNVYIDGNDIFKIKTTKPADSEIGGANGILVYGETAISDIYIENNLVHNNTNGYSENISITGNASKVYVRNNKVYANTNIGIDFSGNYGYCSDATLDAARNCEATGNVVYNNKCPYAECAGIYVDGGRDIKIKDNTVYGNQYGIEIGSEQWNVSWPASRRSSNITVEGNTIYNNLLEGIRIGGYTEDDTTGVVTSVTVKTNVLKNNATSIKTEGYEINLCKCDGVDIASNTFYMKRTDFSMINLDLGGELAKNITHSNNYRNQAKVD